MLKYYPNSLLFIFGSGIFIGGFFLFFRPEFQYRGIIVQPPWTFVVGIAHITGGGAALLLALHRWNLINLQKKANGKTKHTPVECHSQNKKRHNNSHTKR